MKAIGVAIVALLAVIAWNTASIQSPTVNVTIPRPLSADCDGSSGYYSASKSCDYERQGILP